MVNRLNRRVHDGGAPVPVLTAIVHAQEADEINFPAASAAAKSAIRSAITPKSPLLSAIAVATAANENALPAPPS